MANDKYPQISHFAVIDVADFARQNFMYAFHLYIPVGTKSALLQRPGFSAWMSETLNYTGVANLSDKIFTCTIPYVQSISVSRPASAQVIPTLGGGKHVEDRGRTRELITVSGTSGYLPAEKPVTDDFFTPEFWSQPAKNMTANISEIWNGSAQKLREKGKRSGYAWFHRLCALFEIYWNIKRVENPQIAREVKMVWVNERDNKYFVVVPTSFNYNRSAPKNSFTYDWSISLEVIEEFEENLRKQISSANAALTKKNFLQRANAALQKTSQTINAVKDYLNLMTHKVVNEAFRGQVLGLLNTGLDTVLTASSAALSVQQGWVEAGKAVGDDVVAGIDKATAIMSTIDQMVELYQPGGAWSRAWNDLRVNLEFSLNQLKALVSSPREFDTKLYPDSFGGMNEYYRGTRASASLMASSVSSPTAVPTALGPLFNQTPVIGDFGKTTLTSGAPLLGTNILSPGLSEYEIDRSQSRSTWTGVRKARIYMNDTIFDIARREMGDINFWIDLVILNNLKPPYTRSASDDGYPGMLVTGEEILIPGPFTNSFDEIRSLIFSSLRSAPQEFGQATSGNTLTLTDSTKNTLELRWEKDQWTGFTCKILNDLTSPLNTGESRLIKGNDGFNIFFYGTSATPDSPYSPWPGAINNTSSYQLVLEELNPLIKGVNATQNFDRVLGLDLEGQVNSNNNLDLVLNVSGDAAIIEGIPAAAQSILLLIKTPIGANPFLPRDGVPSRIGEKLTPEVVSSYRTLLRKAITSDPRVSGIRGETLIVNKLSDIIGFEATVQFIDGSTTPLGTTS